MPALSAERPALLAVHPAQADWPENILRFHLQFASEMDPHAAATCVWIETGSGARAQGALVDLADGLWSPDGTILTLLFHPGRVKRGLAAHERLGRALTAGEPAWLVLGAGLADLDGRMLPVPLRWPLTITTARLERIDPADWRWTAPAAGSRAPLAIDVGRPLDALSVQGGLRLTDAAGRPLATRLAVAGARVVAVPAEPWPDAIRLEVASWLEDVCGNRPDRAFDGPPMPAEEPTCAGAS